MRALSEPKLIFSISRAVFKDKGKSPVAFPLCTAIPVTGFR